MDDWQTVKYALAELKLCERMLKEKRPDLRRIAIRVAGSSFETIAFGMRRLAVKAAAQREVPISTRERQVLAEIVEPTFADGTAPRRSRADIRESLNVGIIVYARARGTDPPLDTSPLGTPRLPKSFIEMEKIHDRMLHPEETDHLELSKRISGRFEIS